MRSNKRKLPFPTFALLAVPLLAVALLAGCTRERPSVDPVEPAAAPGDGAQVQEPAVVLVDTATPVPTATVEPTATPTPEARTIPYEVRPGDTVSTIAEKFGTDSQTIRELNLLATDDLQVGQVLRVPNVPGVTTPEGLPTPTPEPFEYIIREGDTLLSIAIDFGVSPNEIVAANVLRDPNNLVVGQVLQIPGAVRVEEANVAVTGTEATPAQDSATASTAEDASSPGTHTIQPGEYLTSIAEQYDVSVAELIAINGIGNPDLVKPGTVLVIPGLSAAEVKELNQTTYTVQAGDHLYAIARQFGVEADAIIAANNIRDPNLLRPGDTLIIPDPVP